MWIIIYKLILNLSAVRGTHKVPGQPSPAGHHIIGSRFTVNGSWLWNQSVSLLPHKLWKQKRRGSMYLSALIPDDRPSHCPLIRISNESLPTPADIYTYTTAIAFPEWRNNGTTDLWIHGLLPSHIYTKSVHLSWGVHLIIYIKGNDSRRRDIKSTHVDVSVALPLYQVSKLRSLMIQTVTLRKRPFETGRTTGLRSRSIDVSLTYPPSHGQAFREQR